MTSAPQPWRSVQEAGQLPRGSWRWCPSQGVGLAVLPFWEGGWLGSRDAPRPSGGCRLPPQSPWPWGRSTGQMRGSLSAGPLPRALQSGLPGAAAPSLPWRAQDSSSPASMASNSPFPRLLVSPWNHPWRVVSCQDVGRQEGAPVYRGSDMSAAQCSSPCPRPLSCGSSAGPGRVGTRSPGAQLSSVMQSQPLCPKALPFPFSCLTGPSSLVWSGKCRGIGAGEGPF